MTDSRFYAVLLVVFGSVVIGAVLFLNIMQPSGVDVEIWNRITNPATIIISALILMMKLNSNTNVVVHKVDTIDKKVEVAAVEANTAARNAAKAAGTDVPPKTDLAQFN